MSCCGSVVRNPGHLGLIQDHVSREVNGYALLKDAIEQAKARDPTSRPLVMDVGSNHGLYSLFAAKLGADVVTLEPQVRLCRVINKAAQLNGADVASRITLYNNAALDAREVITLSQADIAEGAIATVVREGSGGGGSEKVEARPISDFIPQGDTRDVCFLKVDVEGFELHAIPSAGMLLDTGRVHNVLVEFGPPNRWGVAQNSADDGVQLLEMMQNKHGFEPRLINSLVWNEYMSRTDESAKTSAKDRNLVPLDSNMRHQEVVDAMARCCEAYVWFTRDVKAAFSTFSSSCGGDGNAARGGDGVAQYGCDKSR
jgi:FkbM family methyltransferase